MYLFGTLAKHESGGLKLTWRTYVESLSPIGIALRNIANIAVLVFICIEIHILYLGRSRVLRPVVHLHIVVHDEDWRSQLRLRKRQEIKGIVVRILKVEGTKHKGQIFLAAETYQADSDKHCFQSQVKFEEQEQEIRSLQQATV